jgi:hypothetical protein
MAGTHDEEAEGLRPQAEPGQQLSSAVLALRVALSKQDDRWLVVDVIPISAR